MNSIARKGSLLSLWFFAAALICLPSLPGRLKSDDIDMYRQALQNQYNDWHSFVVSYFLHLVGPTPGTLAFFLILLAFCMLACIAVTMRHSGSHWGAASLIAVLLCLNPQVMGNITAHGKDTWAAVLMLAISTLLTIEVCRPERSLWWARASLAALLPFMRSETILLLPLFALGELFVGGARPFPLTARMMAVLQVRRWALPVVRLVLFLGVALGGFQASKMIAYRLLAPQPIYTIQAIYLYDLAGISVRTGTLVLPQEAFPSQDLEALRAGYSDLDMSTIVYWSGDTRGKVLMISDPAYVAALKNLWWRTLVHYPRVALEMKWDRYKLYLQGFFWFLDDTYLGDFPQEEKYTKLAMYFPAWNQAINRYFRWFSSGGTWLMSDTAMGSHWLPMVGALVFLGINGVTGLWRRRPDITLMLVIGIAYQLMFFPLCLAAMYRYGFAGVVLFWVQAVASLGVYWREWRLRQGQLGAVT